MPERRDARSASRFITALYKAHLFMGDVPTRLEATRCTNRRGRRCPEGRRGKRPKGNDRGVETACERTACVNSHPRLKLEACCIWTPPQYCRLLRAYSFGFTVRCIRAHRQSACPDPACRARSVIIDRERFTQARILAWNLDRSVVKVPCRLNRLSPTNRSALSLHLSYSF